jgi:hypothetical protein
MKKSNLKAGMVLVTRNEETYIVLPYSGLTSSLYAFNTKNSSQVNLDVWDENLLNRYDNQAMDVLEVRAIKSFRDLISGEITEVTSLWKRPSDAQLKAELEELLAQIQEVLTLF